MVEGQTGDVARAGIMQSQWPQALESLESTFTNTRVLRSTFQRPAALTARARPARSTLNTKSPNTKPARFAFLHPPAPDTLLTFSGFPIRARKAKIRPQAIRLRWSDKACFPQEGKDNQEGRVETGVHVLQDQGTASAQALQALRVGR